MKERRRESEPGFRPHWPKEGDSSNGHKSKSPARPRRAGESRGSNIDGYMYRKVRRMAKVEKFVSTGGEKHPILASTPSPSLSPPSLREWERLTGCNFHAVGPEPNKVQVPASCKNPGRRERESERGEMDQKQDASNYEINRTLTAAIYTRSSLQKSFARS